MAEQAHLPIGVFDSGLGGLTVLRALQEVLPCEDFVYLGDVARLPYGTKSQGVIREYAKQCIEFLVAQRVKAVVIACNTASAMALEALREEFTLPLFGVLHSGARAGLRVATSKRAILVLGTESTVRSEAYLKVFSSLDPQVRVTQLACPLLVPLAEEGWFDHEVTQKVIQQYLSPIDLTSFDGVVLGCTHFPLLEPSFRKVLPSSIQIVHGAHLLADELRLSLERQSSLNTSAQKGKVRLMTTDRISLKLPLLGGWLNQVEPAEVVHLGASA